MEAMVSWRLYHFLLGRNAPGTRWRGGRVCPLSRSERSGEGNLVRPANGLDRTERTKSLITTVTRNLTENSHHSNEFHSALVIHPNARNVCGNCGCCGMDFICTITLNDAVPVAAVVCHQMSSECNLYGCQKIGAYRCHHAIRWWTLKLKYVPITFWPSRNFRGTHSYGWKWHGFCRSLFVVILVSSRRVSWLPNFMLIVIKVKVKKVKFSL